MISGSIGDIMVSALARNARGIDSNLTLGAIFPVCHHGTDCHGLDPSQYTQCMVVEPTLWVNMYVSALAHRLYGCNSKH